MIKKNANRAVILILGIFLAVMCFAIFFHLYLNQPEDLRLHGCKVDEGYVWCESKNKCLRYEEEPCPEPRLLEVKENLIALREQSLDWFDVEQVSEIQEGQLDWHFNDGMIALVKIKTAYLFSLSALNNSDLEKIKNYLLDNGYKELKDKPVNTVEGAFQIAYEKDDYAMVIETKSESEEFSDNDETLYNVKIYCIILE